MCKLMAGVAPGETKNVWVCEDIDSCYEALQWYANLRVGDIILTADDNPAVVMKNMPDKGMVLVATPNEKRLMGVSHSFFMLFYYQIQCNIVGKAVLYDEYLTIEGAEVARGLIRSGQLGAAEHTIHELEELSIGVEDLKKELAEARAENNSDSNIRNILCRMMKQEMQ